MKRWNGWGDEGTHYRLRESAAEYLAAHTGPPSPPRDVSLSEIRVPPTRLPDHPQIATDPETRLRHARGQSLPDWIALRSGRIGVFPDGVAIPQSSEDIRDLLAFVRRVGACAIPYGGGTSVVGGINPERGGPPVLTIDLSRMSDLRVLDETSHLATFGAGASGPQIEAALKPHGFTLGHFPQSFEGSTLGGWIAARSTGQQSLYYGRIENLFAGGRVETPVGILDLPAFPASAAGPDLREWILGSEGRFGIIAEAVVRVRRAPEREEFHAALFPHWEAGLAAVRDLAHVKSSLSMLRLSDAEETRTFFAMSLSPQNVRRADVGLRVLGLGPDKCLLIYGITGKAALVAATRCVMTSVVRSRRGLPLGRRVGHQWAKTRFLTPYLRNELWDRGWATDTVETAASWRNLPNLQSLISRALRTGLEPQERVEAFSHISHVYNDGGTIYATYIFRLAPDPDETLERWRRLKRAVSEAIVAGGGTISHQHGVGVDHAPYLPGEKGKLGIGALEAVRRAFDPEGIMNPGKLLLA